MGQENAESVGSRQLSGIGGQMDFLEGAFRSKGGRGYICLNSSRRDKEGNLRSNIVPTIPGGSTISVPRTMIECVATEYGGARRRHGVYCSSGFPGGAGPVCQGQFPLKAFEPVSFGRKKPKRRPRF